MDVKSIFLNGLINKEVHISQPYAFEDYENPNFVFKLKWVLYGLKQALRSWYERLSGFFIKPGFNHGKVDIALFIRHKENHILLFLI